MAWELWTLATSTGRAPHHLLFPGRTLIPLAAEGVDLTIMRTALKFEAVETERAMERAKARR